MKRLLLTFLVACTSPTQSNATPSTEHVSAPVIAAPTVDSDLEPSLCYTGRRDYRAICQAAGHPWKFAVDERCESEAARPGQPANDYLGGIPFLSTGPDRNVQLHMFRLDCRAEPASEGVMLLCCP